MNDWFWIGAVVGLLATNVMAGWHLRRMSSLLDEMGRTVTEANLHLMRMRDDYIEIGRHANLLYVLAAHWKNMFYIVTNNVDKEDIGG